MADKRFCGICATKGHASSECPRRVSFGGLAAAIDAVRETDSIPEIHRRIVAAETVTQNRNAGGRGKKVHESSAAKQKAYRERNK